MGEEEKKGSEEKPGPLMNAKELLLDIGRTSGANVTNQVVELERKHISTVAELKVKVESDEDIIAST